MNLTWFLTQTPIQELEVYQILNAFEDSSECISLCDMVLPELPSIESKLCLVQYLVKNDFPSDKHYHYFNMLLGLKMLSAIKSGNKDGYADLIAHPYLLLEQMLMNAELKDAEEALKAIINDLEPQNETAPIMSLSSVNQLVEDYASKALEVHFLDALLGL
ncbi:zinc finger FYVE domain-containing protein 26-like [Stegodyphus dumicola]|uniref:zinc finger FYVE domain-containing protein 26-like n=1 Tax=Stegodyphus dumicola TaxID=202533 RepID=UPI0015AE298D|nr:zinc finger FYVE domain-containing protein 26-like [Stegodyphus dumicola]